MTQIKNQRDLHLDQSSEQMVNLDEYFKHKSENEKLMNLTNHTTPLIGVDAKHFEATTNNTPRILVH